MGAFERLDERIQKWIFDKQWTELRPVQASAIEAIVGQEQDVLISAATAGGKTEAAFLPIASEVGAEDAPGISVLCVSPLKALINDQFDRLTEIFDRVDLPVHRWHGDIASSKKRKLKDKPLGVLLITPESLEALFVTEGYRVGRILGQVRRIVIDEAHVFIGSDRGKQLQSLLRRLECRSGRKVPRIGLSATLGDLGLAAEYLRPHCGDGVRIVKDEGAGQEIKLQIRGYEIRQIDEREESSTERPSAAIEIADHLWKVMRGTNNLVFANSRRMVEKLSEILIRRSDQQRVPNEFFPHHGSLAKDLREEAEHQLKAHDRPATAICTSTLELGIDIGQVESVAQVDSPFSVASLRQRLGRSGRRGDASVLRVYVEEDRIDERTVLVDQLRTETVQALAMIELLIEGWCEPPDAAGLNLSTLIQQVLSLIAERGGVAVKESWECLCQSGAFSSVGEKLYASLLRCMAAKDLIRQATDGTLIHGEKGERIVNHYAFFAVFQSKEEFRLLHAGRTLGTLSVDSSLARDILIVFAGKCWRVLEVDAEAGTVAVEPAPGGRMPHFEGGRGGLVHDEVRQRMLDVWSRADSPSYLNKAAGRLLLEGRQTFVRRELFDEPLQREGRGSLLFLCRGDRILNTIIMMLNSRGIEALLTAPVIHIPKADPTTVERELRAILGSTLDGLSLAREVQNKAEAKYDFFLSDELLSIDYASRALDLQGGLDAIRSVLQ